MVAGQNRVQTLLGTDNSSKGKKVETTIQQHNTIIRYNTITDMIQQLMSHKADDIPWSTWESYLLFTMYFYVIVKLPSPEQAPVSPK